MHGFPRGWGWTAVTRTGATTHDGRTLGLGDSHPCFMVQRRLTLAYQQREAPVPTEGAGASWAGEEVAPRTPWVPPDREVPTPC
jgi:hypothetical protein